MSPGDCIHGDIIIAVTDDDVFFLHRDGSLLRVSRADYLGLFFDPEATSENWHDFCGMLARSASK